MSDLNIAAFVTAAAAAAVEIAGAPAEILGAPVGMVLAAHAGALFALAQTPPEKWGKALKIPKGLEGANRVLAVVGRGAGVMLTVVGNAFACAWFVALLPHFMDSLKDAPLAAGAGFLAFGGQHLIPRLFVAIGKRVDGWGGADPEKSDE